MMVGIRPDTGEFFALSNNDVVGWGAAPDLDRIRSLRRAYDADVLVAGGVTDLGMVARLRDAGVAALILGEPLLSGALDLHAVLETAA